MDKRFLGGGPADSGSLCTLRGCKRNEIGSTDHFGKPRVTWRLQDPNAKETLVPEAQIRVNALVFRGIRYGSLVALDPDTLIMRAKNGREFTIPFSSLRQLEVSLGETTSRSRGALIGSAIGAGLAVLFAVSDEVPDDERGAALAVFMMIYFPIGAIASALKGSTMTQWQEVSLSRVRIGLSTRHSGGIGASASFGF